MSLTRGQQSAVLISEGRCWECRGQLERCDDGWGECLCCERRMKFVGGTVHEMVRLETYLLGHIVQLQSGTRILAGDGTVLYIADGHAQIKVPREAEWLAWSYTPEPLETRQ